MDNSSDTTQNWYKDLTIDQLEKEYDTLRPFYCFNSKEDKIKLEHKAVHDILSSLIEGKYIEELFHSVTSIHSTLPFQSWAVASDHYIFGMRRILI